MDPKRRRPKARPCAEALESRSLLTGGAGNTIALMPGTIDKPGGTTAIQFTIDPAHFTRPGGKMTLGIDVVAATGETVAPRIASVVGPNGAALAQVTGAAYDPHVTLTQQQRAGGTRAVLVPIDADPRHPGQPETFTLNVTGTNATAGKFLVGFYLPGDANGDGVVDSSDLQAMAKAQGARAGQSTYRFDADSNRDGRIAANDLAVARRNLGDKVTISPILSANLDPATGGQNRTTSSRTVHFSGLATPGATLTYANISGQAAPVTTTAGDDGHYDTFITLADGVNTFLVTGTDSFGQTISGQIAPVTYSPTAPVSGPDPAATTQATAPTSSTTGTATTTTTTTTTAGTGRNARVVHAPATKAHSVRTTARPKSG